MIDKQALDQILEVVSKRWMEMAGDPDNKAFQTLPGDFWMNAAGGRAGGGKWVTMLMYTENDSDANTFREVLQKWQMKGSQPRQEPGPDLIKIGRKRN